MTLRGSLALAPQGEESSYFLMLRCFAEGKASKHLAQSEACQ